MRGRENARAEYFSRPLVLVAYAESAGWLDARGIAEGVRNASDASDAASTTIAMVVTAAHACAETLPAEAGATVPLVLIFAHGEASPADVVALLQRPNVLAVASTPRMADAVREVSRAPVVDGESADLYPAIAGFARNAGFWVKTYNVPS